MVRLSTELIGPFARVICSQRQQPSFAAARLLFHDSGEIGLNQISRVKNSKWPSATPRILIRTLVAAARVVCLKFSECDGVW